MIMELDEADLGLLGITPPRVEAALRAGGIKTIGGLSRLTVQEVADLPDIGPSAVAIIVDRLRDAGIVLPKEPRAADEPGRMRMRAIRPDTSRVVGQNIRRLREAQGMPRQILVWKMHEHGFNVSEAVLKNMELGMPGKTRRPRWITVDELASFAEVLDVPYEEFFRES
jgi:hypothetical protein